jgi:hypothetical protein
MSPSNGTSATVTPAGHVLLPLVEMNKEYIAKCFGTDKIRAEYVTKVQSTLEAFREMENNDVITLGSKAQDLSIFGMKKHLCHRSK